MSNCRISLCLASLEQKRSKMSGRGPVLKIFYKIIKVEFSLLNINNMKIKLKWALKKRFRQHITFNLNWMKILQEDEFRIVQFLIIPALGGQSHKLESKCTVQQSLSSYQVWKKLVCKCLNVSQHFCHVRWNDIHNATGKHGPTFYSCGSKTNINNKKEKNRERSHELNQTRHHAFLCLQKPDECYRPAKPTLLTSGTWYNWLYLERAAWLAIGRLQVSHEVHHLLLTLLFLWLFLEAYWLLAEGTASKHNDHFNYITIKYSTHLMQ